ncbi:reductase with broad range of substrate specificity [Thozetella sp. PMI_491]|nr:reductase with broad range of substrate specificity [Thozetella sp. PMI_491]
MSMTVADCAGVRDGFPRSVPDIPTNVMEQFSMTGKVVVVTGAAAGFGLAVATGMAEAGASVALYRNAEAIKRAEELGKAVGTRTTAYKVDVSNAEQVQEAIRRVVEDFGRIEVFVANAGKAKSKGIIEQPLEEYKALMAVNVDGVVHCAKFAGEVFKRQGSGNLIITSSMSAHIVNVPVDQPVYNATKAFVAHFGKCLAREWREFARVNIVSPGFFNTKLSASPRAINGVYRMSSLGRQGDVKEIKALYLYLASNASKYMTGSEILIDGGYVLP